MLVQYNITVTIILVSSHFKMRFCSKFYHNFVQFYIINLLYNSFLLSDVFI